MANEKQPAGIPLQCSCGNRWKYKGRHKTYASCPDCKRPVKITKPR